MANIIQFSNFRSMLWHHRVRARAMVGIRIMVRVRVRVRIRGDVRCHTPIWSLQT